MPVCRLLRAPLSATSLRVAALAAAALLAACGGGGETQVQGDASPLTCRLQANDTPDQLLPCVTGEGVQRHLEALARIAAANGGTRAAGTAGYEAALGYVQEQLQQAGYSVSLQPFAYRSYRKLGPGALEEGGAGGPALRHDVLSFSGSGDVTAAVALPSVATGCTAEDFAGFPAGRIALVRRGDCSYPQKAGHAARAGAAGVVIYNHEGVNAVPLGTLGPDFLPELPVVATTRAIGERLAVQAPQGLVLHLRTRTERLQVATANLLAESTGGDPRRAVMAGAHLDAVRGTAGIDDNGSGVAALLETALQMARASPRNRLRVAFWGAEEEGLAGSRHYVDSLPPAQARRIGAYLNFDMIASPNYVYNVYAGDGTPDPGAPPRPWTGADIQRVFADFYAARGLPWQAVAMDDRSDHASFAARGIPSGGIRTVAAGRKTEQEAALWGGTAGERYDACYHRACDRLRNISHEALEVNIDAVANAVLFFAMDAGAP